MTAMLDIAYNNTAFNNEMNNENIPTSHQDTVDEIIIEMPEQDTMQTQMSVEGARAIAGLSPRITVTFHNVCKVISVPAKMIDPSSTERFIERTLLDNVSGQIHSGQVVALMGPSGNQTFIFIFSLHICLNRIWEDNIIKYISWSSIEWCQW
jgi:ABC-type multidrug transport system fused ATPase/permease subunit